MIHHGLPIALETQEGSLPKPNGPGREVSDLPLLLSLRHAMHSTTEGELSRPAMPRPRERGLAGVPPDRRSHVHLRRPATPRRAPPQPNMNTRAGSLPRSQSLTYLIRAGTGATERYKHGSVNKAQVTNYELQQRIKMAPHTAATSVPHRPTTTPGPATMRTGLRVGNPARHGYSAGLPTYTALTVADGDRIYPTPSPNRTRPA